MARLVNDLHTGPAEDRRRASASRRAKKKQGLGVCLEKKWEEKIANSYARNCRIISFIMLYLYINWWYLQIYCYSSDLCWFRHQFRFLFRRWLDDSTLAHVSNWSDLRRVLLLRRCFHIYKSSKIQAKKNPKHFGLCTADLRRTSSSLPIFQTSNAVRKTEAASKASGAM